MFGDRSGDIARTIGSETAGLAKKIGGETADLAKRFGSETASLAKRIGARRGLIGLAVLALAIGGSVVMVRYLRARNRERQREVDETGEDLSAGRTTKSGHRASTQRSPGAQPSH